MTYKWSYEKVYNLLRSSDIHAIQEFKCRDVVGGNVEEQEPGLNLAHTVLYVSHSLHSQTRCDLKPGSKSLQQRGQRGQRRSEKIQA